jgi:uncharacterized protein YndB with AHSA1/START domain
MGWKGRWAVLLLIALCCPVTVYVMGRRLPEEFTVTVSGVVPASVDRTWELVSDTAEGPTWRTGLRHSKYLPPQNGDFCWEEMQSEIGFDLCLQEQVPPMRQVVRFSHDDKDDDTPFHGTWTWELAPIDATRTRVTITERHTQSPTIWRFIHHYLSNEDSAAKQYLKDLQVESVRQR